MSEERGVLSVFNVHSGRETIAELLMGVYWRGDVLLLTVEVQVALISHKKLLSASGRGCNCVSRRMICGRDIMVIITYMRLSIEYFAAVRLIVQSCKTG